MPYGWDLIHVEDELGFQIHAWGPASPSTSDREGNPILQQGMTNSFPGHLDGGMNWKPMHEATQKEARPGWDAGRGPPKELPGQAKIDLQGTPSKIRLGTQCQRTHFTLLNLVVSKQVLSGITIARPHWTQVHGMWHLCSKVIITILARIQALKALASRAQENTCIIIIHEEREPKIKLNHICLHDF